MSTTEYYPTKVAAAYGTRVTVPGSRQIIGGQIVCFAIGGKNRQLFVPDKAKTISVGEEINVGFHGEAIVVLKISGETVLFIENFRKVT